MNKTLVFDMDGTIADLYGVDNWLDALRSFDPTPYQTAEPLYDMVELTYVLGLLKDLGWKIAITSWLSKETNAEYDRLVRQAKREWLERYDFPFDEIHLVKYGTTKADCTRKLGGFQILIDDNAKVRDGWHLGATMDATKDILEMLFQLLEEDIEMDW